jgi:hypothetical protein
LISFILGIAYISVITLGGKISFPARNLITILWLASLELSRYVEGAV